MPFRDAYKKIASNIEAGSFTYDQTASTILMKELSAIFRTERSKNKWTKLLIPSLLPPSVTAIEKLLQ